MAIAPTSLRLTITVQAGVERQGGTAELSRAEIMEITLDNGLPSVLCCYQEDYHRRLDRPEGTWKRVTVPSNIVSLGQLLLPAANEP